MKTSLVRDHFLADHRRLESIFERLLDAFEANDREEMRSLWTDLEHGLLGHLEAEETYLYPAFIQECGARARDMLAQHDRIRQRLADLGAALDLHLVRLDAASAFISELRAHAAEEDQFLYRWADERFEASGRQRLVGALSYLHADRGPAASQPATQ